MKGRVSKTTQSVKQIQDWVGMPPYLSSKAYFEINFGKLGSLPNLQPLKNFQKHRFFTGYTQTSEPNNFTSKYSIATFFFPTERYDTKE